MVKSGERPSWERGAIPASSTPSPAIDLDPKAMEEAPEAEAPVPNAKELTPEA